MSSERIFITGGTGRIGIKCVTDLLDANIPVTLFARDVEKVKSLYPNHYGDLVQVVEGSFDNLDPIKEGVKGHTRLLMLVGDFSKFAQTKGTIAKYAYEVGVKQIVDISSMCIDSGWRLSTIGEIHKSGEQAILDVPNRGTLVALRPNRFMSNHYQGANNLQGDVLYDAVDPNHLEGWISPNDIGAFSAAIFKDDVAKHGDRVYNLNGQMVTGNQRAEILSRVTGRKITYVQDALKRYKFLVEKAHYPHFIAIDLVDTGNGQPEAPINPSIEIILGRKPETLEEYLPTIKNLLN